MSFLAIMLSRDATGPDMHPGPVGTATIIFIVLVCIVIPTVYGLSSVLIKIHLVLLRRRLRLLEKTISAFRPVYVSPKQTPRKDLQSSSEIPDPVIALIQRHWIMEQEIRRLESGHP